MHLLGLLIVAIIQGKMSLSNAASGSNFAFIVEPSRDHSLFIGVRKKRSVYSGVLHAGFGKTSTSNNKNVGKLGPIIEPSQEAKRYLQKHRNNIDAASADYFRSQIEKIRKSDINDKVQDHGEIHEMADLRHEAQVAATWNTIALFLPYDYSRSKWKVEPHVERRLNHVSSAVVRSLNIFENASSVSAPYILDIGCGDGSLLPYLKSAKISQVDMSLDHYYGLDISSEMISLARQRWRHAIGPNNWIEGSFPRQARFLLNELKLKTSNAALGFNVIIFNGSLQFFQDTAQILRDSADLLQNGGHIVLSHVNGAEFVKDECKKNPGIAVRSMPNNVSLDIIAHDLRLKVIRKKEMGLEDYDDTLDGDDGKFYLVVLEKTN